MKDKTIALLQSDRAAQDAVIRIAARLYGWTLQSAMRVGVDVTSRGDVYVGAAYAGQVRDDTVVLNRLAETQEVVRFDDMLEDNPA